MDNFKRFMSEAISTTRFSILSYLMEKLRVLERNPTKADVIIKKENSVIPLLSYKIRFNQKTEQKPHSVNNQMLIREKKKKLIYFVDEGSTD